MSVFHKIVTINFSRLNKKDPAHQWLARMRMKAADVPDLECGVRMNVEIDEFDDDEIEDEFRRRFGVDFDPVARIYRLLAEGNSAAAMDLMAREFDLAPPHHEKKLADLLSRGRGSSHVQS